MAKSTKNNLAYQRDMNYNELLIEKWLRLRFDEVTYYGNYSGNSRWQLFYIDEHVAYIQGTMLMISKNGASLFLDNVLGIPTYTCWRMKEVPVAEYAHWVITSVKWPIIKMAPNGSSDTVYQPLSNVAVPRDMLGKEVPYEQLELFTFKRDALEQFNSHTLVGNTLNFFRYSDIRELKSFSKTRWDRVSNIEVLDVPRTSQVTVGEHVAKNF